MYAGYIGWFTAILHRCQRGSERDGEIAEYVLTHYREVFRDRGRGEGRRVRRNFAAERTREAEVDVAQRNLALVRVGNLKHTGIDEIGV